MHCLNFQVVGVPVTLNGDLKNQFVETNVGFDTICKVLSSDVDSFTLVNSLRSLLVLEKCEFHIKGWPR